MDFKKVIGIDVDIPQIKLREIAHLTPYYRNAKKHSPAQISLLQSIFMDVGWTNPVLVDDEGIVAGHGRCMAAEGLYNRGQQIKFPNGSPIPIGFVPTIDCSGWTPEQRKAYIIADNQSAVFGSEWDFEMLSLEVKELDEADYNLQHLGFTEDELAELLAPELDLGTDVDPDYQPEPPEVPFSVLGDTWVLGAHRLHCGNATEPRDWDRLMVGERADACWTDPPYLVDLGRKNKLMDKAIGGNRSATGSITNDKMTPEEFEAFLRQFYACIFDQLKAGGPIYVAHSDKAGLVFRKTFEEAGFHFSQMLIWNKGQHVLGMADHQPSHEPVMYGWKPGSRHRWYGGRKNKTVMEFGEGGPIRQLEDGRWAISAGDDVLIVSGDAQIEHSPGSVFYEPKPEKSGLHPSTKPVALVERHLKNSARPNDIVIDGCGGSGSTLIAADRLGMQARIMELEPKYCDVICHRYYHITGRVPINEATGKPFPFDDIPKAELDNAPEPDDLGLDSDLDDLF